MKFSADEISSMFEEIILPNDETSQSGDQNIQHHGYDYAACPRVCASRGSEDWWC